MVFCSPTFLRLRETAARFLPAQTQKRRQPDTLYASFEKF
jgi:hypothetical protein